MCAGAPFSPTQPAARWAVADQTVSRAGPFGRAAGSANGGGSQSGGSVDGGVRLDALRTSTRRTASSRVFVTEVPRTALSASAEPVISPLPGTGPQRSEALNGRPRSCSLHAVPTARIGRPAQPGPRRDRARAGTGAAVGCGGTHRLRTALAQAADASTRAAPAACAAVKAQDPGLPEDDSISPT